MLLKEEELYQIQAGGFKVIAAVAAIASFVVGVIDGYLRPMACNLKIRRGRR